MILLICLSDDNKLAESGAAVLQQQVGVPGLHDVSRLHHEDAVTAKDGVHPVGDGQNCPVPQTMLDHLLENEISLTKFLIQLIRKVVM